MGLGFYASEYNVKVQEKNQCKFINVGVQCRFITKLGYDLNIVRLTKQLLLSVVVFKIKVQVYIKGVKYVNACDL